MTKFLGLAMVLMGVAGSAFGTPFPAPEIDASTGASALALVSGGMLVLRSRRNKK